MNSESQQKVTILAEIWCALLHVSAKFVTDRSYLNTLYFIRMECIK